MKNNIAWPVAFLLLLTVVISSWSYDSDFIKELQVRLTAFYKQNPISKIHVILNQPKYAAGDTAFFKVHLLSALDLSPVESKQIINVDLVGKDGKPVLYNRIVSENGIGLGQFIFPTNLAPGNYLLVAYSDEMKKTVSPTLFYSSSLTIAGAKEFVKEDGKYLAAFSEGGRLVAGQRNRVVVQALGKETHATILSSSGKIIETLAIDSSGLASIVFTPVVGEKYYVEANGLKKELPEVMEDGIALQAVKDTDDESILVTLQTSHASQWRSGQLYLVMNMQSKIYFSASVFFKKDTLVSVSIPLKNCPDGIAQLTVFSPQKEVLSERLFYVHQTDPVAATLMLDTIQYHIRKPVKINIAVKDSRNNALRSNLSVSVYREDLFSQNKSSEFLAKLLQSDLGYGQSIAWDKMTEKDKDNFLITQKWKSFQWSELILKNNTAQKTDNALPYYFRGRVVSTERKSLPDSTLITFYLNKASFAYEVYVQQNGQFEFPLFTNFGDDEVFYSVRHKDEVFDDAQVLLAYDSVNPPESFNSTAGTSKDAYFAFSKLKSQVIKSYQYYLDKQKPEKVAEEVDDKKSMLSPDFSVKLDKYNPFLSMADVLNEVVPLVRYNKINGKSVVRVFINETATYSRKSPLYIIDGVMTDSTAFFLGLNPAYVSQISILQSRSKLSKFGSLGKNGIVIVETKIPNHTAIIPRTKRSFNVTGLNSPLAFHSPDYRNENANHIPDIRSSLYWNPILKTSDDGETEVVFYTGDGIGNYIVHVEGITDDGRPFVNETRFNVSFSPTGTLK